MMKCAKYNGNWFRRFEDVSKRCEPSNVADYFFWPTLYDCLVSLSNKNGKPKQLFSIADSQQNRQHTMPTPIPSREGKWQEN